jgi:hypothetical protein
MRAFTQETFVIYRISKEHFIYPQVASGVWPNAELSIREILKELAISFRLICFFFPKDKKLAWVINYGRLGPINIHQIKSRYRIRPVVKRK